MENIIKNVRDELQISADEKTKLSSQHFFKETIKAYGIKTALVDGIAKENYKLLKDRNKADIFDLCETLWQSAYLEESFIACNWAYATRKQFEPADFDRFSHWINSYVNNWASCDTFCNHTMGEFIEMYPDYLTELKRFAGSENRWVRRAAAVSLIIPARRGKFLQDILEIADLLLTDTDDLVQKGYGWMLKAASQSHQQVVFEYVMQNKNKMPRTALRYAIEKMPAELKKQAMIK